MSGGYIYTDSQELQDALEHMTYVAALDAACEWIAIGCNECPASPFMESFECPDDECELTHEDIKGCWIKYFLEKGSEQA